MRPDHKALVLKKSGPSFIFQGQIGFSNIFYTLGFMWANIFKGHLDTWSELFCYIEGSVFAIETLFIYTMFLS